MTCLLSVNRKYTGKLARDDNRWGRFNKSFELEALGANAIAQEIQRGHAITAAHFKKRTTDNLQGVQHIGLDFDTEDERSTLETLQAHPFLSQYAAIFHTTSSHKPEAPRARVLLVLDKPIKEAQQYACYIEALHWKLGLPVDAQCKDAVRVWFGAEDCEIVAEPGRALPVTVLDDLRAEFEAHQSTQEEQRKAESHALDTSASIYPDKALDEAIRDAAAGNRNVTGFRLALRLRDSSLTQSEAWPYMEQFQIGVESLGNHPYSTEEALRSLKSAYSKRPQGANEAQLIADVEALELLTWEGKFAGDGRSARYRFVAALAQIFLTAGRTQQVDLPVRSFAEFGINRNYAMLYLRILEGNQILVIDAKSNGKKASRYSLNLDKIRNMRHEGDIQAGVAAPPAVVCHPRDALFSDTESVIDDAAAGSDDAGAFLRDATPAQLELYRELSPLPHFQRSARVDPRCWALSRELPRDCFGETALRIIATLGAKDGLTKGELAEESCTSRSTVTRKVQLLEQIGVTQVEAGNKASAHSVSLTENWYEKLREVEPALTTFGTGAQRVQQVSRERRRWHGKQLEWNELDADSRKVSETTVENATERIEELDTTKTLLMQRRVSFCEAQGIARKSIPPLGDRGKPHISERSSIWDKTIEEDDAREVEPVQPAEAESSQGQLIKQCDSIPCDANELIQEIEGVLSAAESDQTVLPTDLENGADNKAEDRPWWADAPLPTFGGRAGAGAAAQAAIAASENQRLAMGQRIEKKQRRRRHK